MLYITVIGGGPLLFYTVYLNHLVRIEVYDFNFAWLDNNCLGVTRRQSHAKLCSYFYSEYYITSKAFFCPKLAKNNANLFHHGFAMIVHEFSSGRDVYIVGYDNYAQCMHDVHKLD